MSEWNTFASSNVDAAQYEGGTLFVRFKNGNVYQYDDVPLEVWLNLLTAGSKGKYHYHNIRKSFPYKKVA